MWSKLCQKIGNDTILYMIFQYSSGPVLIQQKFIGFEATLVVFCLLKKYIHTNTNTAESTATGIIELVDRRCRSRIGGQCGICWLGHINRPGIGSASRQSCSKFTKIYINYFAGLCRLSNILLKHHQTLTHDVSLLNQHLRFPSKCHV